jgi:hypothetical protein
MRRFLAIVALATLVACDSFDPLVENTVTGTWRGTSAGQSFVLVMQQASSGRSPERHHHERRHHAQPLDLGDVPAARLLRHAHPNGAAAITYNGTLEGRSMWERSRRAGSTAKGWRCAGPVGRGSTGPRTRRRLDPSTAARNFPAVVAACRDRAPCLRHTALMRLFNALAALTVLALVSASGVAIGPISAGARADSSWRSPEAERAALHVPPGFEVQLVAAEPEIDKPMNLAFDARGACG